MLLVQSSSRPFYQHVQRVAAERRALRQGVPLPVKKPPVKISKPDPFKLINLHRKRHYTLIRGEYGFICAESKPYVEISTARTDLKARPVLKAIADHYEITIAEMRSPARAKLFVQARQHFCWIMRKHTDLSLPQIARFLGGRDHTTILHGIRQHEKRRQGNG